MHTQFINLNTLTKNEVALKLKEAADILKCDGLVAFPTETVYGLGANAFSEKAIKKIFIAKNRPCDNPLIVHIGNKEDVYNLAIDVPPLAISIMDKFWPNALTIVLKKKNIISSSASGGLDTVAIRMPKNEIARSLINFCGFPVAAPSANTSTKPSPTLAKYVYEDLSGKIDMILDGGACSLGIESTVIEVSNDSITILRPGSITKNMLKEVCENVILDKFLLTNTMNSKVEPKSPGMKYKHYAPNANITLVCGCSNKISAYITKCLIDDKKNNIKSIVVAPSEHIHNYANFTLLDIGSIKNLDEIARNLFTILRKCDEIFASKVYIEGFLECEIGLAIMNRLKKASGYTIINVD